MQLIKKRIIASVMVVAVCGVVGVGAVMAGCAPTNDSSSGTTADAGSTNETDSSETKTMQEWGGVYPLQYNSYKTLNYKQYDFNKEDGLELYEDNGGAPGGHYSMLQTEMGPVSRDSSGSLVYAADGRFGIDALEYNSETKQWYVDNSNWVSAINSDGYTKGCYACRSSKFDEAYKKDGAEIYAKPIDQKFADLLNGQMWDCATCHGDTPGSTADAKLSMFTQLSRDSFKDIVPKERVCGQCHTTFNHRRFITDQKTMDSFNPYKYGYDVESLWRASMEDGITWVDEDTGITLAGFDEPELELMQGSAMHKLGVTCVDCHMPQVTDPKTGKTYTNHNASGSPLAKKESLEYCLSCHKAQGIKSTEDMVQMVRSKQREARKALGEAQAERDKVYEMIKTVVQSGKFDKAALDKVRKDYSLAYAYLYVVNGDSMGRAVHNPDILDYITKANNLLDGITKMLK